MALAGGHGFSRAVCTSSTVRFSACGPYLHPTSSRRQDQRTAFRDHQGMFVVSRRPMVSRTDRPAILRYERFPATRRDDRLNRNYQAFGEHLVGFGVGVVGHPRFLVNGASNAVAAQFTN